MQKTITIYIGSNNNTKKVEKDVIIKLISKRHNGFTINSCFGYWMGRSEKSVIVTISDNQDRIIKTINELKAALDQEAIGYSVASGLQFI